MQASKTRNLLTRAFLTVLAALPAAAAAGAGAVFVGTNHNNTHETAPPDEPANEIVAYSRAEDGSLSLLGRFPTGGQGSGPSIRFAGDGLGSAHSVQLSQDHRWLLVTNAGNDPDNDTGDPVGHGSVSVFRVQLDVPGEELKLTDHVSSRGVFPNSIAQYGDLVYVLHAAGEEGNIRGFRLTNDGKLTPLPGSTRGIGANQDPKRPDTLFNPTQVSFTPDGEQLVVTIKDGPPAGAFPNVVPTGPGRVLVFGLGPSGRPGDFTQTDMDNLGPFGFSFDKRGRLLTTLFVGGPPLFVGGPLTGSAGSFAIRRDGSLRPITPNVPNTQLDTCWLENNGRYAYGANYGSGTISSYRIRPNGGLRLLKAVAGSTDNPLNKSQGSTPLDLAIGGDGKFLYNVLPGSGAVAGWRIKHDGSLEKLGEFAGLPDSENGDIAMCRFADGRIEPCEYGPGGSPAGIAAF